MTEVLRLDLASCILFQAKCMFTSGEFLLPGLDLLLPRKGVGLENRIHHLREFSRFFVNIVHAALVAFDLGDGVIAVGFGFSRDGKLGHFLRRLVAFDLLTRALDVEDKGVIR